MRFWRDSGGGGSGGGRDVNGGGTPCGQVRVLVVGDSGVGKSSLVHLILKGSAIARPPKRLDVQLMLNILLMEVLEVLIALIALRVMLKETFLLSSGTFQDTSATKSAIHFFIHKLTRKTKTNLNKWAVEVAESGTFSAPLGSGGPGGLPVPYLVIANKVDIAPRDGKRVSSGNLVDVARQWVEKQGLLPSSEELPLAESFPGNSGLLMAAKVARYDKEALVKFFRMLIRRRYFSNELPAPSPWSLAPREDTILPVETTNDDDLFQRKSYAGQSYKYNGVTPLPAQRNLTPPPTLYPQQPMSSSSENYRYHRFSSSAIPDASSSITNRADINI